MTIELFIWWVSQGIGMGASFYPPPPVLATEGGTGLTIRENWKETIGRNMVATTTAIADTINLLFTEGETICVSVFRHGKVDNQFFDSREEAISFAEQEDARGDRLGVYINVQRLKKGARERKRTDIEAYTHLMVDIDRKTKKVDGMKVMASDEELEHLFDVTKQVNAFVSRKLEAWPIVCMTGNGYQMLWNVEPQPPESFGDFADILRVIKANFESDEVSVDTSVAEPEQLCRLYGTWNRKHPALEGRPQRQSQILTIPGDWTTRPVRDFRLVMLAAEAPVESNAATGVANGGDMPQLDEGWLQNYGVEHLCEWGLPYTPLENTYEKHGKTATFLGIATWKGRTAFTSMNPATRAMCVPVRN